MSQKLRTTRSPSLQQAELPEPWNMWRGTPTSYPREATVHELFENIAAKYPQKVALIFQGKELTYSDLNVRANRLAHILRQHGVTHESMVACCFDRCFDSIVSLLGVLKAGGAYVPLDPSYPSERINFFLQETQARIVLTQNALVDSVLHNRNLSVLSLDDLALTSHSITDANPPSTAGPTSLAYLMFTSGSTGRPKCVMIEHRGIVRLVRDTNYCRLGHDEVFLQFAPTSFDASTFEIWAPLLNGGRLVIAPPQATSLQDIGQLIRKNGITTLWLTAGLFHIMVEQSPESLQTLRQLLAGGDVLSSEHARRFLEKVPRCTLINGYGPTENTTFTCCHSMRAGDPIPSSVPIGRPISNTEVYILDDHLRPVQAGETGELYAGGDGLARGYLNDPAATEAAFFKSPFADNPGDRLYRTGDLARWREDGTIEFIGRNDAQVKILGYRIEPAEIESVLQTHHGVKQVLVVPKCTESGSKYLVAFFVPSDYAAACARELRELAAQQLPAYMIPARFIPLASIPLSPNGKVDRAALAKLDIRTPDQVLPSELSESELEKQIANLWTHLLGVRVGLDDNFFDLGGNSLLLVALHSDLQKVLHAEIPLIDLFQFTTVRKLASYIAEREASGAALSTLQQQADQQRDAYARFRQSHRGDSL